MRKDAPEFKIPPMKASPLSTIDHVYSELKNALMAGEFSPGQPMRLKELAIAFGTSHMPIRESLNRLSGIGVLDRAPRRSIRVPRVTVDGLRSLLKVRLLNERQAILWGTQRCTGGELNRIREINDQMDQFSLTRESDIKHYLQLNQSLHFAIYGLSKNKVLMNTIEALWLQGGPVLNLLKKTVRDGRTMHPYHTMILDNMEKGDGLAAADALQHDIVEAHDQIFKILENTHSNETVTE